MSTVLFHANSMSMRGTDVALFDYACGNERILGNRSLITYYPDLEHAPSVLQKFKDRFELVRMAPHETVDQCIRREQADYFYAIKAGSRDGNVSAEIPSLIHAVFRTVPRDFHGSSFAFVSDWLSKFCSNGRVPAVPHIISLPSVSADLRAELGIPEEATVFGCHGGGDSFDIKFAQAAVESLVKQRRDIWFVFMNILPFVGHERVLFLPGSADMDRKVCFINSCDAMLHARKRGETFGLACAEFSARNKPVITYGCSGERNHIDTLGDKAICYFGPRSLMRILSNFDREVARIGDWDCYSESYSPNVVMRRFEDVLMKPAKAFGVGDNPMYQLDFKGNLARIRERLIRRNHRLSGIWRDWLN